MLPRAGRRGKAASPGSLPSSGGAGRSLEKPPTLCLLPCSGSARVHSLSLGPVGRSEEARSEPQRTGVTLHLKSAVRRSRPAGKGFRPGPGRLGTAYETRRGTNPATALEYAPKMAAHHLGATRERAPLAS